MWMVWAAPNAHGCVWLSEGKENKKLHGTHLFIEAENANAAVDVHVNAPCPLSF